MKEKIFKEALEWYEKQDDKSTVNFEEFMDLIINKTADSIFEKLRDELSNEFDNGNLKHNFIISSDYYLDLKLKDIKQKCINLTEKNKSKKQNDISQTP